MFFPLLIQGGLELSTKMARKYEEPNAASLKMELLVTAVLLLITEVSSSGARVVDGAIGDFAPTGTLRLTPDVSDLAVSSCFSWRIGSGCPGPARPLESPVVQIGSP